MIFDDAAGLADVTEGSKVTAVVTDKWRIDCDVVVCCAGHWTRALAATVGVNVPLVSVEHQYMVTEPIPGVPSKLPTLRDPDRLTYYKEEVGGLVMGGYEPNPIPWAVDGRSEEHTSELQSLMRTSYAVCCLKTKKALTNTSLHTIH